MNALGGATREPLAYPHPRRDDHSYACMVGEQNNGDISVSDDCPGCRAWVLATAVHRPTWVGLRDDGSEQTALDYVRDVLDEFDPMRVLFERALAERGIQ